MNAHAWLSRLAVVAALASGPVMAQGREPAALMSPLFASHGVLQRDRPIPVWGHADPGVLIQVELEGRTVETQTAPDGRWRAILPSLSAGGPYTLTARASSGEVQTAQDVMVGDVYLCSGQSNMELPVRYAQRAWDPVARDHDAWIRLLTVAKDSAAAPRTDLAHPAAWVRAAPDTVEDFSAVCFFFGQSLRETEDVPLGLIADSWGGSSIQTWITAESLRGLGGYDEALDALDLYREDEQRGVERFVRNWREWWRGVSSDQPWTNEDGGNWTPVPDMTRPWEQWGVPALAGFDGMVWYRTSFDVTPAQVRAGGAVLSLGMVDQINLTWVNGRAVGVGEAGDQAYSIPSGVLKPGRNSVVVSVTDSWGDGGIFGPAEGRRLTFANGSRVALDARGWDYRQVTALTSRAPRAPWESLFGLSTLFNGMIAPLHDYGLRGVLWYQGESNADYDQDRYAALMRALMADWRARFDNPDLPFLVVQLANFGALPKQGEASGWAQVREGQRHAVEADPHAGLAVSIDLGDRADIHPAQKREVGRRLAQAAESVIYGGPGTKAGPAAVAAARRGDAAWIRLRDAEGLQAVGSNRAIGFELCGPAEADCRYADAQVEGDGVVVSGLRPGDVVVRYGWADAPILNLFDSSGLPLGPFRLSIDR